MPAHEAEGSEMTSGTLVLNGYVEITVEKDSEDSTLVQLEEPRSVVGCFASSCLS